MSNTEFSRQANKAIAFAKEGMDYLIEIDELQQSLLNQKKDDDYANVVKEIVEKEKLAVSLIQQSTLIQRDLMKKQHQAVRKLIDTI